MLANQELREYELSSLQPRKRYIEIKLKSHDIHMKLDVPDYGVVPRHTPIPSSSQVLQTHTEFKKLLEPGLAQDDSFYKRCAAEVNVINIFFPNVESPSIRICFTAWLVFVISMDDILETLPPHDGEVALLDSIHIMRSLPESERTGASTDTRIQGLTRVLYRHCSHWLSEKVAESFFEAACEVFRAHINELLFLQGHIPNDLSTYMGIRVRTIALNPFFDIIKSEFLPEDSRFNAVWDKLQKEVCRAAGLQNDLIGLERDLENGERLNAVIVLMASENDQLREPSEELLTRYIEQVTTEHNQSTAQAMDLVAQINEEIGTTYSKEVAETARHIVLLCETHLKWCMNAKRYHMKTEDDASAPSANQP
ncbi:isoprenoid synthase domain-containing protein [Xylaria digitata]|nr:isoprenoid synthase domain-containing protein [Xylaria digitata]